MKYLNTICMLMVLFFLWGCAEVPQNTAHHHATKVGHKQSLLARVTVYWANGKGSDRWTRQHRSATGVKLHNGYCAVDSHKIPYGSQVIYPDSTVDIAADTGTDVINRKAARKAGCTIYEKTALVIDKFFETRKEALNWAACHPLFIPLQILPPANAEPPSNEGSNW